MDSSTTNINDVGAASTTVTEVVEPSSSSENPPETPTLRLTLQKPNSDKKVSWNSNTVDNEHLNRKKSKCCCIYKKPREFGESSSESEDEDECDHCFGHVDKKKKKKKSQSNDSDSNLPENG